MRQIGSLTKAHEAERFAAYLVTQGVAAHAEQDGDEWAIWVRDENQLAQARQLLAEFREHPADARYQNVQRTAAAIRQEEAQRREAARRNIVEMRGKWGRGGAATARRAPLVFVLIGLCVIASLWTKGINGQQALRDENKQADVMRFASRASMLKMQDDGQAAAFVDIRSGEVWRLITPIFVHVGAWHLVMNSIFLYGFGSQIEHHEGTVKLGLLVLATALVSNVAQALFTGPNFFGISGVASGLFGYVWIKSRYEAGSRLTVSNFMVVFFVGYLFYCLFQNEVIANGAHFVGLGVGAIAAYLPQLLTPPAGK